MSNDICNDLMVDIFKRLPPKSIIRFRSLSKYWHSSLFTPDFLRDHRLRCSKTPQKAIVSHLTRYGNCKFKNMYTLHSADRLPFGPESGRTPIPGFEFPHDVQVIGSCNGIVCLVNTQFILSNFSVRRKLIVPRHTRLKFDSKDVKVALGFGFDPITDDYKIVAIDRYNHVTFIYSLKKNSWIAIPTPSKLSAAYELKPNSCFFNGILHWVVDGNLTNTSRYILTFDVSSHVFGRILFPDVWRIILFPEVWKIQQLTIINGCLAMISRDLKPDNSWSIWAMIEYNNVESWCKLSGFRTKPGSLVRVVQPLTNGEVLAYYDCEINITGMMCERWNSEAIFLKLGIERYVESLELLDSVRAKPFGETIFSWTKEGVKYYRIRLDYPQHPSQMQSSQHIISAFH